MSDQNPSGGYETESSSFERSWTDVSFGVFDPEYEVLRLYMQSQQSIDDLMYDRHITQIQHNQRIRYSQPSEAVNESMRRRRFRIGKKVTAMFRKNKRETV